MRASAHHQAASSTLSHRLRQPAHASPRAGATGQVARSAANCACGGGCQRCLGLGLQRQALFSAAISMPGDPLEREADAAADAVLRGAEPARLGTGHGTMIARDADETAAAKLLVEEEMAQKKWGRAYGADPATDYAAERGSIDEDVTYTGSDKQQHTRHQPDMAAASAATGPSGVNPTKGTPMDTTAALSDADVETVMMDPGYDAKQQAQITKASTGAGARITAAFQAMQIDTLEAQALYLAHAAVESRGLRTMTAQADPKVVGKFMGRGPLQITFRQNYIKALAYLDEQASRLEAKGRTADAELLRGASAAVKADPAAAADPQFAFIFSAAAMHASGGVQASAQMKGRDPQFGGTDPEDRWMTGGANFDERLAHWNAQKAQGKAGADERIAYWKGVKAAGGRKAKAYRRALDVLKKNVKP